MFAFIFRLLLLTLIEFILCGDKTEPSFNLYLVPIKIETILACCIFIIFSYGCCIQLIFIISNSHSS